MATCLQHNSLSLLDLPREIVIKIFEHECITLEDRMNLRITCKAMESIVAESDLFTRSSTMVNGQYHRYVLIIQQCCRFELEEHSSNCETYIKGMFMDRNLEKRECVVPHGRHNAFFHLLSRLFRRAHFSKIAVHCACSSDVPEGHMNVNQLLELSNSLACKDLFINIDQYDDSKRVANVIRNIKPSSKLEIHFIPLETSSGFPDMFIDNDLLLNLPPVPTLRICQYTVTSRIVDSTILSLLAKHCHLTLDGNFTLQPDTLLATTKIIASHDHLLELNICQVWLLESLKYVGVDFDGRKLFSTDNSVNVNSTVCKDCSPSLVDYAIDVNGTRISIFHFSPANRVLNLVVTVRIPEPEAIDPEELALMQFTEMFGVALAIVHDGAKKDTQGELTKLLGKDLPASEVSSLYSTLASALKGGRVLRASRHCLHSSFNEKSKGVITCVANRFFLDKQFTLKPAYQSHVEKVFSAGVESIDFNDGKGSADHVNSFVSRNTGGMIPQLVDEDVFADDSVAVLINALYFKGEWQTPFNKDETRKKPFHGIAGLRDIDFMWAYNLNTRYTLSDDLTADPSYSLVVLMPSGDFGEWRDNLTAEQLQGTIENLQKGKIDLELPKFKIESATDGKVALQKLGVKRIFEKTANLSGISDEKLYVSKILHKAVIEVSEEGTKAAAATAVVFEVECLIIPPHLIFDRPFLYAIVKNNSDVLFIGQKA